MFLTRFIFVTLIALPNAFGSPLGRLRLKPESLAAKADGPYLAWSMTDPNREIFGGHQGSQFQLQENSAHEMTMSWPKSLFERPHLVVVNENREVLRSQRVPTYSKDKDVGEVKIKAVGTQPQRACVTEKTKSSELSLCSPWMFKENKLEEPQIILNDKKFPLAGRIQIAPDTYLKMNVRWPNQMNLVGQLSPANFQVYEIQPVNKEDLQVIGYGDSIQGEVSPIVSPRSAFLRHTIGDFREFVSFKIPKSTPVFNVRGGSGFLWGYSVTIKKTPPTELSLDLLARQPTSTYSDEVTVRGPWPKKGELRSQQMKVEKEDDHFVWTFSAEKPREMNFSEMTLEIPAEKKSWALDYEIYRSYPRYVSAMLGVSLATQLSVAAVGDFSYAHWFEEPLGSSYWLSRQRWGLFTSFTQSALSSVSNMNYMSARADLRYRLSPGVYEWDETLALTAGVAEFKYEDGPTGRMAGGGILWSRSLPEWFDYAFGFIPFFRNPKWVDVSINYYGVPLQPNQRGSIIEIRGTGKINLSRQSYFEGGWGIINADITDDLRQQQVIFTAGRGFFGFGFRF